ncbi:MAG: hypothetical protein OXH57_05735 [Ekhidna sp.]|nr:hypothetical protein [Ekhidna sp.]
MKLQINILKVVLYICLILIGILVGKFIDFPYFEISKSIDLVNVTSIVVTVLLAVLITVFFDKRRSDNRIEKDLILRRVENVYEITNELQKKSISGEILYTEAVSSIKRISTSMKSIYKTIDKCQFSIKDDIKTSIQNTIGKLRDILTNNPPKVTKGQIKKLDLPIKVKNENAQLESKANYNGIWSNDSNVIIKKTEKNKRSFDFKDLPAKTYLVATLLFILIVIGLIYYFKK